MEFDIKQLINVRAQGLNQFVAENDSPEDVLFYLIDGQLGMTLVPFEGEFPPSYKYNVRKQVMNSILSGTLSPQLKRASKIVYFSFDSVYNLDYCFEVECSNNMITLYIHRNGSIVRRYKDFDLNYDERQDIAQL